MAKAVVLGAAGRMGKAILRVLAESPYGLSLGGAVEAEGHPALGRDAFEEAGAGRAGLPITSDFPAALASSDVAIDFTHASSAPLHALQAARAGKPLVLGSTGLSPEQAASVREAAGRIACVLSPNMSVGVNLMFRVAADVAKVLGNEYDVEIVEVHHRFKKDSPSGTAVRLAESVAEALGRDLGEAGVYGRRGMTGERTRGEIGVFAVRAGDVVGEHTLVFGGIGERLEITHRAHSRDTFARGAVRAAAWLLGREPGLYDMRAVLGL